MRTAVDSITGAGVLAGLQANPGAEVVMGYDDGAWPDASTLAQMFPGKTVVRFTTDPNDNEGDALDVETGDATPAQAPGWTARRRQAGHPGPLTYFPDSWRSLVVQAYQQQGVPLPGLFPAAYPGGGPVLIDPTTDVGHQYANFSAGNYDLSVVVDYLPGIDPVPQQEDLILMGLPTGCTDMGAVNAYIRETFNTYSTAPMSGAEQQLFAYYWNLPTNQTAWGKPGYGRVEDFLLGNIVDYIQTTGHMRPERAGSV